MEVSIRELSESHADSIIGELEPPARRLVVAKPIVC